MNIEEELPVDVVVCKLAEVCFVPITQKEEESVAALVVVSQTQQKKCTGEDGDPTKQRRAAVQDGADA